MLFNIKNIGIPRTNIKHEKKQTVFHVKHTVGFFFWAPSGFFHLKPTTYFVLFAMEKTDTPLVSRETYTAAQIVKRFETDPLFMSTFSLLRHRESLTLNTANPSFILCWLLAAKQQGYFPLVLIENEFAAESFYADALAFFPSETLAWIPLFQSDSAVRNRSVLENHLNRFVSDFYEDSIDMLISSEKVFDCRVPDKKGLREHILYIKTGQEIEFSGLANRLHEMGYQRSEMVEYCGEFAIRGGIVDIYPYGEAYPLRVDFFADTVESLRRFNPHDQNTFETCDSGHVRPASFSSFVHSTVGNILPEHALIVRIADSKNSNEMPVYLPAVQRKQILFDAQALQPDVAFSIAPVDPPRNVRDTAYYTNLIQQNSKIVVFSGHDLVLESLREKLGNHADYVPENIRHGFYYKPLDLVLLSGRELYHKEHYVNPNKRFIPERSNRIDSIESLRYGDAIVHIDYGIGIYRGIEPLSFRGVRQEAMVVEYKNKDIVYVPVRYMNKIFRYTGENAKQVSLDQLGSTRWDQVKHSTRQHLRKTVYDLLSLYRDRKKLPGFAFDKDTPDQLRLEASFPYDETRDQRLAISETKMDMESSRIMDRLICGDVGFGKTEVAIRATFKAVYSGKQVAILVPTTLLCFQHYETFRERLEPFGIRVEYINRFVPRTALKTLIREINENKIDVLIGTHKILSNTLFFNDLGLLIIDEEHRFGVNHKEKIQNMKRQVDVMTLTATPIPRTLQISLAGLRDITKIDTPPKERLPIATKIIYWNDRDIHAAIERELERNGQVFILNNHIDELPSMQHDISGMFPLRDVRYAHGKMPGPELEKTLLDFYHHEFDILISTTIIESGIDIPNANTLIVLNAHTFGLSQLYQIRGRVGRSYKKAFAYLVIPRGRHINPTAMKRLQTLEYYTDLGSGYQIAMRDLEIRGAGNLFGVEQSGHINRMGFAYYNRMFSEEVEALKASTDGAAPSRREGADIQLDHPAYLPETYISNKDIRISFYRELSSALSDITDHAKALRRIEHLAASCRDRFGVLPEEAENLFRDARLSLWLKSYYIETLLRKDTKLIMSFVKNVPVDILQQAAGKFLHLCNQHHIPIEFISKKYLMARVHDKFLNSFYGGTFFNTLDSMPIN